MEKIKMEWQNWDDICDFVPDDQFISGVYVDDNGEETEDAGYGRLGLKIVINGVDRVAKEGEYLLKELLALVLFLLTTLLVVLTVLNVLKLKH